MVIFDKTSWDTSRNFVGATGKSAEVLGVFERPGMPKAIIVRIKGVRADFPVGVKAYIKTKTYDAAGPVFYHYDKGIADKGEVNVYIRIAYKGNDPGGGMLSREPIVAEQAREVVDTQTAGPGTIAAEEKKESAEVKAKTGILAPITAKIGAIPKRTMLIGAIVLIGGFLIAKKLK